MGPDINIKDGHRGRKIMRLISATLLRFWMTAFTCGRSGVGITKAAVHVAYTCQCPVLVARRMERIKNPSSPLADFLSSAFDAVGVGAVERPLLRRLPTLRM